MKKLKEIWFVIWDAETLIALVYGIIGIGQHLWHINYTPYCLL